MSGIEIKALNVLCLSLVSTK